MTDCEARRLFAFINDFLDRERADAHLHMLVTFASDTGTVRTAPLDAHKKCLRLLKTWARAPHVLGAVSALRHRQPHRGRGLALAARGGGELNEVVCGQADAGAGGCAS